MFAAKKVLLFESLKCLPEGVGGVDFSALSILSSQISVSTTD